MLHLQQKHENQRRTKSTHKATKRKGKNTINSITKVPNQSVQILTEPTLNASKTFSKKFKEAPFSPVLVACAAYLQDLSLNCLKNFTRNYAKKMLPSTFVENLDFKSMVSGIYALPATVI